ncbi:flagellin [Clostridium pascui]|uniref:flagellin N-terminal helical domain-containing protein n=1 Tax=Clostridium pascui TaxID=46609 RepID=UPI001957B2E4|nr:flagellin [Clostridium pascui]MBM7869422.1 flagellin [Clostridium pascui]
MRLMQNMSSQRIYRQYQKSLINQSKALKHISSGEKFTKAGEAPNEIAKSERMRLQIRGLQMAQKNAQDGISMMQTADGALDSMTNTMQRVRELLVQAGNGTNSPEDKETILNEVKQMIDGYDDMAKNSEFNGTSLFDPEDGVNSVKMQLGANAYENVEIKFYNLRAEELKDLETGESLNLNLIIGSVKDNDFGSAIDQIDSVIKNLSNVRSKYGALANKFEQCFEGLGEFEMATQAAESSIRDTDIAEEMMEFTKNNILIESGNAMMVQSNKLPQEILRILESVKSR